MIDYKDKNNTSIQRAKALLSQLSVKEKMAQLNCWMPENSHELSGLNEFEQGVGHISTLQMRMEKTLQDCVGMQKRIQTKIMEMSPHNIPAIFHMEGLCGAFIQDATSFPSGIARGAAWNPQLEQKIGEIVGRQERAVGITQTFAPVLDISRDSRMGRQGETYGEDATLAAALGVAYTKGVQQTTGSTKTHAVAKHFLGFHASQGGIHGTDCDISPRELREVYAKPFQAAITHGHLQGIMPCYNSINGEPVSASAEIMNDLLRTEMGFDGMTVSDYCAIKNIHDVQCVCENETQAGLLSMQSGMDVELHFKHCFNDELVEWFENGKANVEVLDKAVLRVLTAKFDMGLFENPFALTNTQLLQEFYNENDKGISLQAAKESLVLLKNDSLLPFAKNVKKVAIIGSLANTARIFYGGYTHFSMAEGMHAAIKTMAGVQSNKEDVNVKIETISGTNIQADSDVFEKELKKQNPNAKSLVEYLKAYLDESLVTYSQGFAIAGDDCSYHEEALKIAQEADAVILAVGGKHSTSSIASMGEGIDATDINLPMCQESFIEKLGQTGKKFAVVHFNGRPISSDAVDKYAQAVLEAWNPAEFGAQAVVETLFGEYNPGGKMPVTTARNSGQIPIYYNHANGSSYHQGESIGFADYVDCPHAPRYYFGHGLSYTSFEYSNFTVDKSEDEKMLNIGVTIKNVGEYDGDEIVQIYGKDRFATLTQPVLSLAGFCRVHLEKNQSKSICFKLPTSFFAFYCKNGKWKVEAGEFGFFVGASSNDIRGQANVKIDSTQSVEPQSRGFYAEVEVE